MLRFSHLLPLTAAMCTVVVLSNYLVQFPVNQSVADVNLADLLTWGAFTYPVAFLVTDLANRSLGANKARKVAFSGFALAVALSFYLATPRIAVASGTAFLSAQMLDISVFERLRNSAWWHAPLLSSFLGSTLDTIIFFSLAFSPAFVFLGTKDIFATEGASFLGIFPFEVSRWISWATGDYAVKLFVSLTMLVPYRVLIGTIFRPFSKQSARV